MARDPANLEALLDETRWVRALARRLCADAATADDLAQDAWVAALEHPPRDASASRAWFARVLGNLARQRGRSESARARRERATAAHESFAEDVVARAETSRRLASLVLALDEPYRSTLLAHFFDGLAPSEIARRTGTNASTVRTRLERGLARLRAELERADGRGWLAALAPLTTGTGTKSAAGAALTTGIAMTAATKIGIALALACGLGWYAWDRAAHEREPGLAVQPARVVERAQAADAPVDPRSDPGRAPVEAAAAITPAPAAPRADARTVAEIDALATPVEPGFLEGIVLRGDVPIAGGTLYFWRGHWRPIPPAPDHLLGDLERGGLERAPIGNDGRFRVGPLAADWYSLAVDAGAGVGAQTYVQVDATTAGRRVVIVLGGARIEGTVYDVEGAPVVGAAVRLSREGQPGPIEQYAITDGAGRYDLPDLRPQDYWISLDVAGNVGIEAAVVDMRRLEPLRADETRVVDFGVPGRSVSWRGRVVLADGAAPPFGGRLGRTAPDGAYSEVALAADGAFELRLRPGEHELQVALSTTSSGLGTGYIGLGRRDVGAHDFERDLVVPGCTVAGRVLGLDPAAVPRHASLALAGTDGRPVQTAEIGADGRFRFVAVGPGRWRAVAGPVLAVASETWIEVRDGDVSIPFDVPLRKP